MFIQVTGIPDYDEETCDMTSEQVEVNNFAQHLLKEDYWTDYLYNLVNNNEVIKQLNALGFYKKEQLIKIDSTDIVMGDLLMTHGVLGYIYPITQLNQYALNGKEKFYIEVKDSLLEKLRPEDYAKFKKLKLKAKAVEAKKKKAQDIAKEKKKQKEIDKAKKMLEKEGLI